MWASSNIFIRLIKFTLCFSCLKDQDRLFHDIILHMKQDLNNIIHILQSYQVKKAALFGSYARGDNNKKSDIDILIELPKGMSLFGFADLKMDLEEKLKKEVDLVTYRSIHPLLKDQIIREQKILYETQ